VGYSSNPNNIDLPFLTTYSSKPVCSQPFHISETMPLPPDMSTTVQNQEPDPVVQEDSATRNPIYFALPLEIRLRILHYILPFVIRNPNAAVPRPPRHISTTASIPQTHWRSYYRERNPNGPLHDYCYLGSLRRWNGGALEVLDWPEKDLLRLTGVCRAFREDVWGYVLREGLVGMCVAVNFVNCLGLQTVGRSKGPGYDNGRRGRRWLDVDT
jgi:hypothetical protein